MKEREAKPIACLLSALTEEEDARRRELTRGLEKAVRGTAELPDGLRYDLGPAEDAWLWAAELITLERRCCPFLSFALSAVSGDASFSLAVTGPPGTRAFLQTTRWLGP